MNYRIKTLAEIDEQHDRICEYLNRQGRTESSRKVTKLYDDMTGRIIDMLGIEEFNDESMERLLEDPLIVGTY